MHAITLRGIDEETYTVIRKLSKTTHTSINKLVVNLLKEKAGTQGAKVNKNFDSFFGSWNSQEYKKFLKTTKSLRTIDKELWE